MAEQMDLGALKDRIIGHAQEKQSCVETGSLESVVRILQSSRTPTPVRLGKESGPGQDQTRSVSEEEVTRLEALQVLSSLTMGGPAFLAPMRAAGAIPLILENIYPRVNHAQVVLAALRALSNMAEVACQRPTAEEANGLADTLFSPRYMDPLYSILASDSRAAVVQEQKCLLATLISRLCQITAQQDGRHHNALANAGILDALATMLASFAVRRGEVIPGAELLGRADGLDEMIPPPAPRRLSLAPVLGAISALIAESHFRTFMLLCSPAIMAVFPPAEFPAARQDVKETRLSRHFPSRYTGAMQYLLPLVTPVLSTPTSLPPAQPAAPSRPFSLAIANCPDGETEADTPLILWLIHLTRSTTGIERVMSASVMATLLRTGPWMRDAQLVSLVVPVLCQLIKEHDKESIPPADCLFVHPEVATRWAILEEAPAVLARLTQRLQSQQAITDNDMVRMACKLLRDSYELLPQQTLPKLWTATPRSDGKAGPRAETRRLGPPGMLPIYMHRVRLREGALKLIASLIACKDEYRKIVIEVDMVPFVAESLMRFPRKPTSAKDASDTADREPEDATVATSIYCNNPDSVIIAACNVVRVLSRSVSSLRTTLLDHGIAIPIFRLLSHANPEVQVAACGAICNLVTEFSPMRERLVEAGILKILCEHAKSLDPDLRLNSIWALKHLVHAADNRLKKQVMDELESGCLVRLVCNDIEDEALHIRMQQDGHPLDSDSDEDMQEPCEHFARPWLWPALYRTNSTRSTSQRAHSPRILQAESKLKALREAELTPTQRARCTDLDIQEQALNFIRNLIMPPSHGTKGHGHDAEPSQDLTEMVDYIIGELDSNRFFDILTKKLRPKCLRPFSRRRSDDRSESRVLYPKPKVVEAVIYILVHMAASVPRHRQLVIAQTELVKTLLNYFSCGDVGVRRALVHLFSNLTCTDGTSDFLSCVQRAAELRRLGVLHKLEALAKGDDDLDIRERARAAVHQIKG